MASIAVRINDSTAWKFAEGTRCPDEAFLRDLLFEEPRLIPAREIGVNPEAAVVTLREVGLPGAGSSDVILIDSDGKVVVVECKLAANPEKKRAVIGQVLDYASSLARMSYDDLDERARRVFQRPLHEAMQEKVPTDQWDEDRFLTAVSRTLAAGTFGLVIAIDEMDADLSRIVRYVSSRSSGSLRIFGLEMRYHTQDDVEVIIPHIANPIGIGEDDAQHRWRSWDPEQFRNELGRLDDEQVREAAEDILDFALPNPNGLYWGRANDYGSFGYRVAVAGKPMSLFTYYTGGTIYINLGTLRSKVPGAVFEQFVEAMAGLRGFERVTTGLDGWPQFQTRDTLADELVRTGFKNAVIALQKAVVDI